MLLFAFSLLLFIPLIGLFLKAQSHRNGGRKLPPGPRPLPIIGNLHLMGSHPHRALAKLARQYGPIMTIRLGLIPTIVVSSPDAAALFLRQYDAVFASRPFSHVSDEFSYHGKDIGFTHGDYWRRVRKMCTVHLLSAAKVEESEELRTAEIRAAMRRLAAAREAVDVGEAMRELIEGMVVRMVVGNGKGLNEEERNDFRKLIKETLALAGVFNISDFIPCLAFLDLQGLVRKAKAIRKAMDEIFEKIFDEHLNEEDFGKHKGLIGVLLSLMNNLSDDYLPSFDRNNAKAVMFDLFIAGIDSMASTITWAFSALLKHPRVMKLLQIELDTVIGKDRIIEESDLLKLPFLDMILKETFRLYPVGPLLIPHESMEDVLVTGFMIPKKTRVLVNAWAIGHDPTVWPERTEEFYPERFMDKKIDVRGQNFELIPFGAGRRGCPGLQLGLITVKMVVAQLVYCFDWELPNGMKPEELKMDESFGLSMPRANKLLAKPNYRLSFTL